MLDCRAKNQATSRRRRRPNLKAAAFSTRLLRPPSLEAILFADASAVCPALTQALLRLTVRVPKTDSANPTFMAVNHGRIRDSPQLAVEPLLPLAGKLRGRR